MPRIEIYQADCEPVKMDIPEGAYLVGAGSDCHIRLSRPDISRHHAQLVISADRITVIDLGSSNGTTIGNSSEPIFSQRPTQVESGCDIKFGRSTSMKVFLSQAESVPAQKNTQPSAPQMSAQQPRTSEDVSGVVMPEKGDIPKLDISGIPAALRPVAQEIKKQAHRELLVRLNLKKLALSGVSEEELNNRAAAMVKEILSQLSVKLPVGLRLDIIEKELIQEAIGLGPLENLIARDDISEIMVNAPDQVFVEKGGVIYRTDTAFADDAQVLSAIERIVSPLGRRIDESSPMVDARLADGSRVNAIIPPLALGGPSITIRKFSRTPLKAQDLVNFGSISPQMVKFLAVCVAVRKNILISGGTGSGKTTLLNVLSGFLPNRERIITIEDAAELQLHQDHIVRLEARPPNIEGRGEITIRDLVRNSLRMRPDRIVVGECRGGEALDMLQAMNTGHDGSLTTIHANSPRDALSRLETLVLMSGFDLPLRAIREQIASAINIVVQISRERDGSRKVVNISEIIKMEGDIITMQDIFNFRQTGWSDDGKICGVFEPTGSIPSFMEDIRRAKLDCDVSLFSQK
ncbi:MAG: Flp pilus assembly complex ATPase component TadA [Lentisphaeria bacterium]|nr:Flp pilus assembly complex ATPase component TadA [Lentisphaeria bacterium]